MPTLLVSVILIMLRVSDPGMITELTPSPALIPARAPFSHCISPSAYKNITKDEVALVASTH